MQTYVPITLIIADDHPIVRKGLRDMIEADSGLRVLAEASDGQEAWDAIVALTPRVAVLDISMPHMSGIEIARRIQQEALPTSVIILTVYDDEEYCRKAVDCGVLGYILKESAVTDIVRGIRRVAEGDYFISPTMAGAVLGSQAGHGAHAKFRPGFEKVTKTEMHILRLISRDMSTREIADELSISQRTVDRHRSNIAAKLKLRGSFSLLRFALENKERL